MNDRGGSIILPLSYPGDGDDVEVLTTKVSTKGQVILPKAVRDERRWPPGTELKVEMTEHGGVLLSPLQRLPPTKHEDVFGMLHHDGPPKTIEEMNDSIARMIEQRRASGRY